jgi:hypothetical protein
MAPTQGWITMRNSQHLNAMGYQPIVYEESRCFINKPTPADNARDVNFAIGELLRQGRLPDSGQR